MRNIRSRYNMDPFEVNPEVQTGLNTIVTAPVDFASCFYLSVCCNLVYLRANTKTSYGQFYVPIQRHDDDHSGPLNRKTVSSGGFSIGLCCFFSIGICASREFQYTDKLTNSAPDQLTAIEQSESGAEKRTTEQREYCALGICCCCGPRCSTSNSAFFSNANPVYGIVVSPTTNNLYPVLNNALPMR